MRSPNVDVSIVRTIFENLPDALFKTHIAMTHAACKPPDTSSGPVPYEEWNAQRQNILRSVFSHTTGDQSSQWLCLLVENHHRCRTNAVGEPVLPNGVTWRPQFLAGICVATHGAKASGLRAPGARKATNPVERQQDMVRRLMQQVRFILSLFGSAVLVCHLSVFLHQRVVKPVAVTACGEPPLLPHECSRGASASKRHLMATLVFGRRLSRKGLGAAQRLHRGKPYQQDMVRSLIQQVHLARSLFRFVQRAMCPCCSAFSSASCEAYFPILDVLEIAHAHALASHA
jgi:hypothetical protein